MPKRANSWRRLHAPSREASLPPPAESIAGAHHAVLACSGPAWAIDAAEGCIVAANAKGWERLGLSPGCSALVLDNRMPALGQLRRLGPRLDAEVTVTAALEFWTETGGERLVCEVRRLDGPGGQRHLLIELAFPHEREGPQTAANDDGARPLRDDLETLKEIARRIREGQRELAERARLMETSSEPEPGRASLNPGFEPGRAARAAHELKTPVSAIAVAAEIMRDERLGAMGNDRYKDYAARIAENAHHALAVIDRMLETAPTERTPVPVTDAALPRETDIGALLRSVAASVAPLAERSRLDLTLDLAPQLPHLAADATGLRQIVLNLLTNALKFTPAGGRVTLSARTNANGTVTFAVRDTGPGMTRAAILRVLERPADAAPAAREGGGLGLGLPLVRELARGMGATLDIDSAIGRGTIVTLQFPAQRIASLDARTAAKDGR